MKKKIILVLLASLFMLGIQAQEWVPMNELISKIPLGKQTRCYTDSRKEVDCTLRMFSQSIPIRKIRLSKQKQDEVYVFSELPDGKVQGYYLVNHKKKTVQIGEKSKQVIKLDKTPLVDGQWYEYDFGCYVYLKSVEMYNISEFHGVEVMLPDGARDMIRKNSANFEKKWKAQISELTSDLSNNYSSYSDFSSGPFYKHTTYIQYFVDKCSYAMTAPMPMSETEAKLIDCSLTTLEVDRKLENEYSDSERETILNYLRDVLKRPDISVSSQLINTSIDGYRQQKVEVARQQEYQNREEEHQNALSEVEQILLNAKNQKRVTLNGYDTELYIENDRVYQKRLPRQKGWLQKFNGKWYPATEKDTITNVSQQEKNIRVEYTNGSHVDKPGSLIRIEYTNGDYVEMEENVAHSINYPSNEKSYVVHSARLHKRFLNGEEGVLTINAPVLKDNERWFSFQFGNGDVYTSNSISLNAVSQASSANENWAEEFNDGTNILFICGFDVDLFNVLYCHGLEMYKGTLTLTNGTSEIVRDGSAPILTRRNEAQQAEKRKAIAPKLAGKWKVTRMYSDAYNKCEGMGFSMTFQFMANGKYTIWLSYAPPSLKAGHKLSFTVSGTWNVAGENEITLDRERWYENVSLTYNGSDPWDRMRVRELNESPAVSAASIVEGLGTLGRQHIFNDNIMSNITFQGNTLTCNYYAEDWNSCTMQRTK